MDAMPGVNMEAMAVLEQLGVSDPRLHQLVQLLAAQNAASASSATQDAENAAELASLRERLEALEEQNALLIERARMFAAAVGACVQCWGEGLECRTCRGEGVPGRYVPDPACFDTFIRPVLERLQARARARAARQRQDESGGAAQPTPNQGQP
jgi:hypothetical protein